MDADFIGNFPHARPNCAGCGEPLLIENAWMTDGCPCNTPLGVNNDNETRWRLLMQLQQRQSFALADLRAAAEKVAKRWGSDVPEDEDHDIQRLKDAIAKAKG